MICVLFRFCSQIINVCSIKKIETVMFELGQMILFNKMTRYYYFYQLIKKLDLSTQKKMGLTLSSKGSWGVMFLLIIG